VFTLPRLLFLLSLYNKEFIYNLLFQAASETLISFGNNPKWLGGELGFVGVLHSWGQTMCRPRVGPWQVFVMNEEAF
jgi:hypothetical protein